MGYDDTLSLSNGGGEDHISSLPNALLCNIISRLPLKNAVRTTTFSPRWRRVWASIPLVLDDSNLRKVLPDDGGTNWRAIADAVSSVLHTHPGPFHYVRLCLSCNYAASQDGGMLLCSWLHVLAERGVQQLLLANHSLVDYAGLPKDILHIASLEGLYLDACVFPITNNLIRDACVFPQLLDLRLCRTLMRTIDLDRLLQYCLKLTKLVLYLSVKNPPIILICSLSLRCLVFWKSIAHEVDHWLRSGYHSLGYLNPAIHLLKIFETIIKVGTMPSRRTIIPSVSILAVQVKLGDPEEAKMLLSFLRCFPNVETLHIKADEVDESSGMINLNFLEGGRPHQLCEAAAWKPPQARFGQPAVLGDWRDSETVGDGPIHDPYKILMESWWWAGGGGAVVVSRIISSLSISRMPKYE
ncbi:hypothetical protein C2845_PM11G28300 [Panicum miliaceum]|uniref:F-box domain-containing protein n=1 Tax=Panicum miliaceum TaxID=4540 RepID=A0A3L6RRC2_PANMI|nr:hypothetical protein C2845_PM11G28300 [Panicum miliaceum]